MMTTAGGAHRRAPLRPAYEVEECIGRAQWPCRLGPDRVYHPLTGPRTSPLLKGRGRGSERLARPGACSQVPSLDGWAK